VDHSNKQLHLHTFVYYICCRPRQSTDPNDPRWFQLLRYEVFAKLYRRDTTCRHITRVSGLYVIQITDRDGVPLLRVSHFQEKNVDFALMPSFIPTFTTACDQASKLGLGRNKTIISMYSNYQVGVSTAVDKD